MMTRAVYHPVWLLAVLAVVALLLGRPKRKTLLVSAIAPSGGGSPLVFQELCASGEFRQQLLAGDEPGQALAPFPEGDGGSVPGGAPSIGLASKTLSRTR